MRAWVMSVLRRLRAVVRGPAHQRDLEDEVAFHLAMREEQLRAAGRRDAHVEALRRFGNPTTTRDDMKRAWAWRPDFTGAGAELRYVLRALRHSPGHAIVVVVTLSVAMGPTTAMFSVMHAALFRPLPYPQTERLGMVWTERASSATQQGRSGFATVERLKREGRSFDSVAFFDPVSATLTLNDAALQVGVVRASPNLFAVLDLPLVQGRVFSWHEAEQGAAVALISRRLWQEQFGESPTVLGRSINLDGRSSTIIGVLAPASPALGQDAAVWEPYTRFPNWEQVRQATGPGGWFVIGRVGPNATFARAEAEATALLRSDPAATSPTAVPLVARLTPLASYLTTARTRLAFWMLFALVACVLMIAAINVASLSLTRAMSRRRDVAIRIALGASRGRLVSEALLESGVLAILASGLGIAFAAAAVQVVRAAFPQGIGVATDISIGFWPASAAIALSLLMTLACSAAPAVFVGGRFPNGALVEEGRSVSGGSRVRTLRRVFVTIQLTMAVALAIPAGLLIRSLLAAESVDLGFANDSVVALQLSTARGDDDARRIDRVSRVIEEVSTIPGVTSAGVIGDFVISGAADQLITLEGPAGGTAIRTRFRRDEVSERLFEVLGAPLLQGRAFSTEDTASSPRVAIVNQALARDLWGTPDVVGKRFKFGRSDSTPAWLAVVGVVGDMRRQGPEIEPVPQMFEPMRQNPSRLTTLLVKGRPDGTMPRSTTLRDRIQAVDPQMAVYGSTPLDERFGAFLALRRFQTELVIAFSMVAMLVAAVGIYGLIHDSVTMRKKEVAIRLALGGQVPRIVANIVREGLTLALIGLAFGCVGAIAMARLGSDLLFRVAAVDPWTYLVVAASIITIAVVASYLPARGIAAINPVETLRK
jgi:predicted permease